jgi:hypothetical protein
MGNKSTSPLFKYSGRVILAVFLIVLVGACLLLSSPLIHGIQLARDAPFKPISEPISLEELEGVWENEYSEKRQDTIVITSEGKFIQKYQEQEEGNDVFTFETQPSNFWIEFLNDGRAYLHLTGARYYFDGISGYERHFNFQVPCNNENNPECKQGKQPIAFHAYDWIGQEWVEMNDELILNIRLDSKGNIILVHMWSYSDRGFPIIGGEAEIFRRVSDSD